MCPNLLSYLSVLIGPYHLSIRKVQSRLKSQFGDTFSTGAISEAQGRVSNMLTPLHQALHRKIKRSPIVHIDETSHHRNSLDQTQWTWLASASDVVFQKIMGSRRQECAQYMLGKTFTGIAVTAKLQYVIADKEQRRPVNAMWVFLSSPDIPLTNNEAERCIRGSVILRNEQL